MTIAEVLTKHTPDLMNLPGVIGTGEGMTDGKPCIVVFLSAANDSLPKSIEGFAVVPEVVGDVRALRQNPTE